MVRPVSTGRTILAEKSPPFGRIDNLQTGPNLSARNLQFPAGIAFSREIKWKNFEIEDECGIRKFVANLLSGKEEKVWLGTPHYSSCLDMSSTVMLQLAGNPFNRFTASP